MPFDPTNFKVPANVTVLPPTTPDRNGGGGPRRIVVNIEIAPAQCTRRPPGWLGLFAWAVIALILLGALAHAEGRHGQGWPQLQHQGPNWTSTLTQPDGSGGSYTFPQDDTATGGGGHGCHNYVGGDGYARSDCW